MSKLQYFISKSMIQNSNQGNKKEPSKKALDLNGGNDEACLGLLAVHNFCTPFWFFLRKTALRQVVHRDVTRPHFVRSSHLPKSAELAKAILTTINSAIKKSHTRWLLLMAGTTRLELATSCVTGQNWHKIYILQILYNS